MALSFDETIDLVDQKARKAERAGVAAFLRARAAAEREAGWKRPDLRDEHDRAARALSVAADDVAAGLYGDDVVEGEG